MVDKIKNLDLRKDKYKTPEAVKTAPTPVAYMGQKYNSPWDDSIWDGGKFSGGFGTTQIQQIDYWTLRKRSEQLFNENLYAAGLIKRLVTNIINTGLMPEACPFEDIIGVAEDSLNLWSETVETRFSIWASLPIVCDYNHCLTWGGLQRAAKTEAFINGDALVVLRVSKKTKMPQVQLISGNDVQTPYYFENTELNKSHEIKHGVELDAKKRVVAYWVRQDDGTTKRIPAYGRKSGRRMAWLVFGNEKRFGSTRGVPLLSLVLQSLKEIDRYRDSTQRKAVINSILAAFVKKTEDKPGTLPIQGGAVRRDAISITDSDGKARKFNIANHIPGMVIEELQHGEEPVLKGGEGTDINFPVFEQAIIQAVAWANEVPPEILTLAFSNNYSASQAAINEFKIYLNKEWSSFGESFCTPIYVEWLLSEVLLQKINAPGLLEAWTNPAEYDVFGAWLFVEWYGNIKPSTDMVKQAKGSKLLIDEGWSTNAREARGITGTKYSKNIKRIKQENMLKADAMRPLLELKREFGEPAVSGATAELEDNVLHLIDIIEDTGT